MPLPGFLIAGFQKCGTHWIASNLREHPQVFIPKRELHFFDDDQVNSKGNQWYRMHFAGADNYISIGERTPNYITAPKAPARIRSLIPHVRLIVTMRNPVDRAISALLHHSQNKRYALSVDMEGKLLELLNQGDDRYGILSFGRYCDHLERYLDSFSLNQFLFVVLEEDIVRNSESTLKKICRFLNIEGDLNFPRSACIENRGLTTPLGLWVSRITILNRRVGYHAALIFERLNRNKRPTISDEVNSLLYESFLPTIERLERIINRDLACWKPPRQGMVKAL